MMREVANRITQDALSYGLCPARASAFQAVVEGVLVELVQRVREAEMRRQQERQRLHGGDVA